MKNEPLFDVTQPMTKALNAPVFTQEKTYLSIVGKSLKIVGEAEARREQASRLAYNPANQPYAIETSSLLDADVMKTLGKGGGLVNEES